MNVKFVIDVFKKAKKNNNQALKKIKIEETIDVVTRAKSNQVKFIYFYYFILRSKYISYLITINHRYLTLAEKYVYNMVKAH